MFPPYFQRNCRRIILNVTPKQPCAVSFTLASQVTDTIIQCTLMSKIKNTDLPLLNYSTSIFLQCVKNAAREIVVLKCIISYNKSIFQMSINSKTSLGHCRLNTLDRKVCMYVLSICEHLHIMREQRNS